MCEWGRGDGLAAFSGGAAGTPERGRATAALWKELLLEGAVGVPSLMATHGGTAPTFVDAARRAALVAPHTAH